MPRKKPSKGYKAARAKRKNPAEVIGMAAAAPPSIAILKNATERMRLASTPHELQRIAASTVVDLFLTAIEAMPPDQLPRKLRKLHLNYRDKSK